MSWVADSGVIRRNHLVGFCIAISGVAAMLNFLYTDFPSFAAYSAIYGLVGGVYFSFYPIQYNAKSLLDLNRKSATVT
jgi:hypothetical protein